MGRRMGGNKLFLAAEGNLLFNRILSRLSPFFAETLIAVGPEDRDPLEKLLSGRGSKWPVKVTVDACKGRGPLEGLASSLEALGTDWAFLIGCDMLQVQEVIVRTMWTARRNDSDVICARLGGFLEPLHAFYSVSCLPAVGKALISGQRKLKSFYDWVNVTVVEENTLSHLPGYRRSFQDVNTPEELLRMMDHRLP